MDARLRSWRLALATGLIYVAHPASAAPPRLPSLERPATQRSSTQESTEAQRLKDELSKISAFLSKTTEPAQISDYSQRQAELIAHLVNHSPAAERPALVRQMAECLSLAATNSPPNDQKAYRRLLRLEDQVARQMPGSDLAAYVTFLEMQVNFAARQAAAGDDFTRVQEERRDRLANFVQTYPKAGDTPACLLELGMLCEFLGKEEDAKQWYEETVKRCGGTQPAFKAQGALRRLDLDGKYIFLELPALENEDGQAKKVDITQLRGKLVIVYFWASWDPRSQHDFTALAKLMDQYREQGLELLTVNLDKNPDEARAFLRNVPVQGLHTYQANGLDGTVTTRYGIMGLPTMFVVGKSGKVAYRSVEINSVEMLIKEQLKKQ